jgi:hypothetical protein
MQGSKEISWLNNHDGDSVEDSDVAANDAAVQEVEAAKPDGWQQYRQWISKAPVPHSRRMGVDPAVYTWKGYRSWTEQIKRNWSES